MQAQESECDEVIISEDKTEAQELTEPEHGAEIAVPVIGESLQETAVPESPILEEPIEKEAVIETPDLEPIETEIKEENLSSDSTIEDEVGIPPSDLEKTSSDIY